jgi:hypothetical protein
VFAGLYYLNAHESLCTAEDYLTNGTWGSWRQCGYEHLGKSFWKPKSVPLPGESDEMIAQTSLIGQSIGG